MGSNIDLRDQQTSQQVDSTLGELLSGKKGYKLNKETPVIRCPNCKKQFKTDGKFCPECGSKLFEEKKTNCPACKKPLKGNEKFCTECGAKI
jgi:rRNA maturation endonuclease Nob1